MGRGPSLIACTVGAGLLACACAQAADEALETVTVTGTLGTAQAPLPASSTVGGDALQGADTVLDVIDRLPGVVAFQKGGAGGGSYLALRGGEPNHTLVLLEGVRVNDPTNSAGGAFDFGLLDPQALGQVSVQRGGLSAVHGADALSGSVELRLRTLADGSRLASGSSWFDSRSGWGVGSTIGGAGKSGSLLASASLSDSGRDTGASTRRRWQALATAHSRLGAVRLQGSVLHADTKRSDFPEDSGGERLAVNRQLEQASGRFDLAAIEAAAAEPQAARWQPVATASLSRQASDADTPWIAPGVLQGVPAIRAVTEFRRSDLGLRAVGPLGRGVRAAVGLSQARESGTGDGSVDFGMLVPTRFSLTRDMLSGYAEATVGARSALGATAGVRYDKPGGQPGHWTSRLVGSLAVGRAGLAPYVAWSQGYKLPSLYALAYPLIANPALRPERSSNLELGLQAAGRESGSWRVAAFRSRYTDLIDFDPQLFTNVNRSRVDVDGAELEWRHAAGARWETALGATYLDARSGDGAVLRSRPHLRATADLAWHASSGSDAWLRAAWQGGSFDSSVPTGTVAASPWLRLDAGWRVQAARGVRLSLALTNLLDRRYEPAVGTRAAPRMARLTVEASR